MLWPVRRELQAPWRLVLGPLDLWCMPGPSELELAWTTGGESTRVAAEPEPGEPPEGASRLRIAVARPTVTIVPRSAPRAVVARVERPVWVGPGRAIRVYVSTPLWLRVETEAGPAPEIPAQAIKHTWSGPTTDGQLCVATRTPLRLDLAGLPPHPHRLLTAIDLHNHHDQPLSVDRVALPLPLARIFETERGLWTETLRLIHRGERTDATPTGPPREVASARVVAEARAPAERSVLKDVFSAVLAGVT